MKSFLLLALASQTVGQALLSVLQTRPGVLDTLNFYINSSTTLTKLLTSANNFTFLAPSNSALQSWLASRGSTPLTQDEVDSTLSYHLLHGGFPTVSFSSTPEFANSNLTNSNYANVTQGQAVELVSTQNGAQFVTGNKSVTTIATHDIVCTGGLIHIVNSVLNIPKGIVELLTQSNLNFFIGILNKGGYLNAAAQPLVRPVLDNPNQTVFAPNTAGALASFSSISASASQADLGAMLNYHVVPGYIGYSSSLRDGMVLKTIQGNNLYISVIGGDIYVNSAKVIASDFLVANGVLHTIDILLDRNNATRPTITASSTSRTSAPTSTRSSEPLSTPVPGLTVAAKAGIGVGIVLGAVALAAALWFFKWQRRRRSAVKEMQISTPFISEIGTGSRQGHRGLDPNSSETTQGTINKIAPSQHAVELEASKQEYRNNKPLPKPFFQIRM